MPIADPRRSAEARELVAGEFNTIAKDILTPLIDVLAIARRYFRGDMDKFLVMLVIGVRTSGDPTFRALDEAQRTAGDAPLPGLGTNGRSIAASLDMPRESVRRKVTELIAAGWVAREEGKLLLTTRGYRELTPVREALKRLAATHFEAISALAAAKGQG
jgi:hypothetical protein